MAGPRFRFAPPTASHGAGGSLALTVNADRSLGAGQCPDAKRSPLVRNLLIRTAIQAEPTQPALTFPLSTANCLVMSVQNAMLFLAAARSNTSLRSALQAQQDDAEVLCRLGKQYDLSFGADDLQQAFRHEWALRALRLANAPRGFSEPPISDN